MARANLHVSDELINQFHNSQSLEGPRWISITVVNETISLENTQPRSGSVSDDFNTLNQHLREDSARLVAFCLDDEVPTGGLRWLLVAWVPDNCPVRDKMLYSSSRDDIRKRLGQNSFKGEYYCNVLSDLTWAGYADTQRRHSITNLLSEKEKLLKEEGMLERDTNLRSNAMGSIPFSMTDDLTQVMEAFKRGELNWVEIRIDMDSETAIPGTSSTVDCSGSLAGYVSEGVPSFIALAYAALASDKPIYFFIYSCPEEAPVREKMTYSTAKSNIIEAANALGITFDKTTDITETSEIDGAISFELTNQATPAGHLTHTQAHSKPSRPGRGRRRLVKKR